MREIDPAAEPKAFLQQIRHLDLELEGMEQARTSLWKGLISPGGIGGSVSGTRDPDRFGRVFARIEAIDRKMDAYREQIVDMKETAEDLIESVEDSRQRMVLRARYLSKRWDSWEYLARKMHYDRRTVLRIHGRALESFRRAAAEKRPEGGL